MGKIIALIVAAGTGERLGTSIPKQYLKLDNKTTIEHSIAKFKTHPLVNNICVVINREHEKLFKEIFGDDVGYCFGGKERNNSVKFGLEHIASQNPDYVLIHDAARPFVEKSTISKAITLLKKHDAVLVASKVVDTIKKSSNQVIEHTVPREQLFAAQTPQCFAFNKILALHQKYQHEIFTDDCALFERENLPVTILEASRNNFKITTEEDFLTAKIMGNNMTKTKTGIGFDVHKFTKNKESSIILCGIKIPCKYSIIAHSDGDVALHAITDALLGTIGAGDIGYYFPPTEAKWKNADSRIFLEHAIKLIHEKGGSIVNIDLIIIGQQPKINPYRNKLTENLAKLCELPIEDVNIKATTTEKLGYLGREEGIACQAVATVQF